MTNERPFHEQYEVRASNGNQVLEDLTAASARIAELEDWQRRALEWMRAEVAGDMAALCGCQRCSERMKLVEEATR